MFIAEPATLRVRSSPVGSGERDRREGKTPAASSQCSVLPFCSVRGSNWSFLIRPSLPLAQCSSRISAGRSTAALSSSKKGQGGGHRNAESPGNGQACLELQGSQKPKPVSCTSASAASTYRRRRLAHAIGVRNGRDDAGGARQTDLRQASDVVGVKQVRRGYRHGKNAGLAISSLSPRPWRRFFFWSRA